MIFFEVKDTNRNIILSSNMHECSDSKLFLDNKNNTLSTNNLRSKYKKFDNVSVWLIIKGDKDLLKSNRLLNKLMPAYANISKNLMDYYTDKIATNSHSLTTIHGQMKQKLQGFASAKKFRGINYEESKSNIAEIVKSNPEKTAETLCYINKRIADIGASIDGFNIMYLNENTKLIKTKNVNIKKVLQTIMAPFLDDFSKNRIRINLNINDDYARSNCIPINYNFLDLAMHNFFNNLIKYVKADSDIEISFNKNHKKFEIKFEMFSIKIEDNEKDRIFDEGYSGINVESAGYGKGMHITQKALSHMNSTMNIVINNSSTVSDSNGIYAKNVFIISN